MQKFEDRRSEEFEAWQEDVALALDEASTGFDTEEQKLLAAELESDRELLRQLGELAPDDLLLAEVRRSVMSKVRDEQRGVARIQRRRLFQAVAAVALLSSALGLWWFTNVEEPFEDSSTIARTEISVEAADRWHPDLPVLSDLSPELDLSPGLDLSPELIPERVSGSESSPSASTEKLASELPAGDRLAQETSAQDGPLEAAWMEERLFDFGEPEQEEGSSLKPEPQPDRRITWVTDDPDVVIHWLVDAS